MANAAAERITGSLDIYDPEHRREASVNFITCHDGFTLHDLYSYNEKHNEENGWDNTDGESNNNSWNCGVEGPTDDPDIIKLRKKMVRNAFTLLLLSKGTPMIWQEMSSEIHNTAITIHIAKIMKSHGLIGRI